MYRSHGRQLRNRTLHRGSFFGRFADPIFTRRGFFHSDCEHQQSHNVAESKFQCRTDRWRGALAPGVPDASGEETLSDQVKLTPAAGFRSLARQLVLRLPHGEKLWESGIGEVAEEAINRNVPEEMSAIQLAEKIGLLPEKPLHRKKRRRRVPNA